MEKHEFEIEIRKNGEVKVHVRGAKGKRCLDYVTFFEKVIGKLKEKQLTSEYYEPDSKVEIRVEQKERTGQA